MRMIVIEFINFFHFMQGHFNTTSSGTGKVTLFKLIFPKQNITSQ